MEGVTVFGNANGTAGSSLSTLTNPWGISANSDKSMLIVDQNTRRLLRVLENATTAVVIMNSTSIAYSRKALYDVQLLNVYFMYYPNCNIRKNYNGSSSYTTVFARGCGTNVTQFANSAGFTIDSSGNFYIADNSNHRILYWSLNGTISLILAGVTGEIGNGTMHLRHPQDIALNETQGVMYVGDSYNHRIMRYNIGSPNGTVVAGGNGPGNARK